MNLHLMFAVVAFATQSREAPFLAVCREPLGEVFVARDQARHAPKLCEKLRPGDTIFCGKGGRVECYDFLTHERLTFLPNSVALVQATSFQIQSGPLPLRKPLPSGLRLSLPGQAAGVLVTRNPAHRLKILAPHFALRSAPSKLAWSIDPGSAEPSELQVQIAHAGDSPIFRQALTGAPSSVQLPANLLEPGVIYTLKISGNFGGRTEITTARFWILGPKESAEITQAEREAVEGDSETRSMLGFFYWQFGLLDDALMTYRNILAKDPGNSNAIAAEKTLRGQLGDSLVH